MNDIAKLFKFNTIYVIESLNADEPKTGQELYNDIIVRCSYKKQDLLHELCLVSSRVDFFDALKKIGDNVRLDKEIPILHFEIHGNQNGFVLNSNELVIWKELKPYLISINTSIGNHLFITSAVCFGGYLSSILTVSDRSPFYGMIGTFTEVVLNEHFDSFQEFYQELLSSAHFTNACRAFRNANPGKKFYSLFTDEIFLNAYSQYVAENERPGFIDKRAEEAVSENLKQYPLVGSRSDRRKQKRLLLKQFKSELLRRRNEFYINTAVNYFMLDLFPDNKKRFDIPDSYDEMIKRESFISKIHLQDL